jgi:hypothetical protein
MEITNATAALRILKKLKQLPPALYDVLDKATTQAREFFDSKDQKIHSALFPSLVRYFALRLLQSDKYKKIGFRLVELSNVGLFIVYQRDGCTYGLRMRKADEDGDLPIDNLSETLKQYYTQADPFPRLPGMSLEEMDQFLTPDQMKLVILWDVDGAFVLNSVQLVCPNGIPGDVYFVGDIPPAVTTIAAKPTVDEVTEDDLEITPRRKSKTGTKE